VLSATRHRLTASPLPLSDKLVLDLPTTEGWKAELTKAAGYILRWFICLQTVTHPSTNLARRRATSLVGHNVLLLHHATNPTTNLCCCDLRVLQAALHAQESLVAGLRDERKVWSDELAQQGAALAQDRGRLESRVEALQTELAEARKKSDRDLDALRIKSKVMLEIYV